MKAYEEWVFGSASKDWIRDEFTGAEAGWRAALEWALSRECDDAILSCEIEQELEEVT